ncbi:TetR family transcriptional regulator C-terminal domain-containing protein [Phaeocystidibacter luteus]|uniref:TetR/AcrR family transcriptional regulator n=1 Tax=Phaeocystidibacter luteus TaxID=911197 RepID=A0A6N6RLG9_9FLAO|nr:TetR family transcriptional regulator C-terminal domain-containing protein [Phaeocystidibacter luteus]KAB2814419.1 TetR/AcrR family transcriptional regulator [Phaeocystidibacter luteus]
MATSAQSKKKKVTQESLRDAYVRHYCLEGARPNSVFAFCDNQGITEKDFYDHFTSFQQIESSIWKDAFDRAFEQVSDDESLKELSVRDRFLTFSFAWVEVLKENRSFFQLNFKDQWSPLPGETLRNLRSHVKHSLKTWVIEGTSNGEIERRFKMSDHYDEALWILTLFITGFWLKDESAGFEKTDAAIEKSVNLAFDLLSKGSLDSALDLGKFLFQNFR